MTDDDRDPIIEARDEAAFVNWLKAEGRWLPSWDAEVSEARARLDEEKAAAEERESP